MISAGEAKNKRKKKDGLITLKYIIVYMKIVFIISVVLVRPSILG